MVRICVFLLLRELEQLWLRESIYLALVVVMRRKILKKEKAVWGIEVNEYYSYPLTVFEGLIVTDGEVTN
jgi:hypothetical protein